MAIISTLPLPSKYPVLTSNEVGIKVIDTVAVIEHAVRRCGKQTAVLTAEELDFGSTNLHLILSSLSNRGINLWAVDQQALPLVRGQAAYALPSGTEKILNIKYRTGNRLLGETKLSGDSFCSVTLPDAQEFDTVGFKLDKRTSIQLVMEYSLDGEEWLVYHNFTDVILDAGWHWHTFDPPKYAKAFRIRDTEQRDLSFADMALIGSSSDKDIAQLNRDSYTDLTNKSRKGVPSNYFFDKQIEAELVLWPTPESEEAQVIFWRQRRIQDVGSLAQKLEIPERWFDAIIWALAKNMAFELQGVPTEKITLCVSMAAESLRDAELGESDQAPFYLQPNISGYTS